jgi:hypothetical protein
MKRVVAGLVLCLGLALGIAGAEAKPKKAPRPPQSTFLPAPSFPASTLAIDLVGRPRAGGIVRLSMSGSNAPNEISSGVYTPYSLDVFVQNRKILPTCPRAYNDELNNLINLGVSRVLFNSSEGDFGPFRIPVIFQSLRKVRKLTACAYSRSVIDDVAVSALQFNLRRPKPK